jgi:hypothetical protein
VRRAAEASDSSIILLGTLDSGDEALDEAS